MNRFVKRIACCTMALIACTSMASCDIINGFLGNESSDRESSSSTETPIAKSYNITFDYNYEGAPEAVVSKVEEGDSATKPSDPTRTGYIFNGWYTDAACTTKADVIAAINKDTTFYAGWLEETVKVTVTFQHYEDTAETAEVIKGGTITAPAEPKREGYLFEGWYADSGYETAFDFATVIETETVIYAKWMEVQEGYVVVTYMWNCDGLGVYKRESIKSNSKLVQLATISKEGYYFAGWCTEEECINTYVAGNGRVTENLTLYANWYYGNIFEAEYTDFTDKESYGYSENVSETNMIIPDTTNTASGGYYVGAMYVSGVSIEFNIVSDKAVNDAVLYFRLSAEYFTAGAGFANGLTLTNTDWRVEINGSDLKYDPLIFTGIKDGMLEKRAFTDFYMGKISLKEGNNVIKLIVNNDIKGPGGTMWAAAPLVDNMTIYTGSTLTWTPMEDNIK